MTGDRPGPARRYARALRAYRRMAGEPVISRRLGVVPRRLAAPPGTLITNPSVVVTAQGRLIAARELGYTLRRGRRVPSPASDGRSHTWLYVDSGDPTPTRLRIEDGRGVIGATGLEDPRLFVEGDRLRALWTTGEPAGVPGGFRNRIVLGEIVDGAIRDCRSLPSPHRRDREKNWMPFTIDDRPHVMYDISRMEVYAVDGGDLRLVNRLPAAIDELTGLSGSSQLIPWDAGGWLCVCHRALRNAPVRGVPYVFYRHHLLLLSPDFRLRRVSPAFFLSHRGVEFCAGLALDGDRVVVSYSENDANALLLELDRAQIDSLLA